MAALTTLKLNLFCTVLILVISCKESSKENDNQMPTIASEFIQNDAAVKVTMEGSTHMLFQKELNPVKATFVHDTLQFVFYTNEHPFKLNLNLNNTNIIQRNSATYTIPETNANKTKVDLSFYNGERDVKSTNKRIIFRKGTISITKITEHELYMTFEGEGSGVLEYGKNFPISGQIKATF